LLGAVGRELELEFQLEEFNKLLLMDVHLLDRLLGAFSNVVRIQFSGECEYIDGKFRIHIGVLVSGHAKELWNCEACVLELSLDCMMEIVVS
jgi:hypothetical protein